MGWRNPLKFGWFGEYDKAENEVEGVSSKPDPYAYRGGVLNSFKGQVNNLVKFCGNWIRSDSGIHDEVGYMVIRAIGSQSDEGVVAIGAKGAGEEGVTEVFFVGRHKIISSVPIEVPGGAMSAGRVTRFYTDGGRFCISWQDDTGKPDGVVYDTGGYTDESKWKAVGRVRIDPL